MIRIVVVGVAIVAADSIIRQIAVVADRDSAAITSVVDVASCDYSMARSMVG
jgi:hypothetical protein